MEGDKEENEKEVKEAEEESLEGEGEKSVVSKEEKDDESPRVVVGDNKKQSTTMKKDSVSTITSTTTSIIHEPSEEQPASVCETEEGSEDYFADVGFMFDSCQPVRLERFRWTTTQQHKDNEEEEDTEQERRITVTLHVVDDDTPGALQSGHYLWPGASLLAEYLVKTSSTNSSTAATPTTIVELGAGCALPSLTALQVFVQDVQCIVVTDHDPGTLVRARDNLESTLQDIIVNDTNNDDDDDDEHLNTAINEMASVPFEFETLEWGDATSVDSILWKIQQHMSTTTTTDSSNHHHSTSSSSTPATATATPTAAVDLVLGSDLIYSKDVVEPLLQTAAQLIGSKSAGGGGRFVLSQSFGYDAETEAEMDRVCDKLALKRTILQQLQNDDDDDDGVKRIQEFVVAASTTMT